MLTRSSGFVDQICRQCACGNGAKASRSSRADSSISAAFGCDRVSIRTTSLNSVWTCFLSGRAKIVRMIDATIGAAVLSTFASTLRVK